LGYLGGRREGEGEREREREINLLTLPVIISQLYSLVFIGCLEEEAVFVGYKVTRM
jgi:hypothetical protein